MSVVVTNESWISRIGGSIKGLVVGLLLVVISVPVLFWNEGRAVRTAKGLKEGAGAVVKLDSDSVSPENDGQFVHVTGTAHTDEVLSDDTFGVSVNGIRLSRNAETYQWVEKTKKKTKKKLGGGTRTETTYSYQKEWKSDRVISGNFHDRTGHENPESLKFTSQTQQADKVTLGGFRLPDSLIRQIEKPQPLAIDADNLATDIAPEITIRDEDAMTRAYWRSGGQYDGTPKIGDTRVSFSATPITNVSVMSKQNADTFEPFHTQFGTQLNMLTVGTVSPENMIAQAEAENAQMTWILRGVGSAMMFFGFIFLLRPLVILADVIPPLGWLVGAGTGAVAFLLAGSISLITISIAWLYYRPLLASALIAVAVALLVVLFLRARSARRATNDALEINPHAVGRS
ncbi:MAG: hypothetical protein HKN47_21165 [Pirellulaceae bacterium]|nr:hypothetical protein [Pirellulaceae bacterium]